MCVQCVYPDVVRELIIHVSFARTAIGDAGLSRAPNDYTFDYLIEY